MISSHVKIWMISVISSLSLKLYLNSLVYHQNIFGSSSKVFSNLRKSSNIFGNFRKFSENFRERSSGLKNLRKSSENHQKRRHQYVDIIKRTLHVSSKIWILCSRGNNILFFIFQVWLTRSPVRSNVQSSRIFVHGFAVYLVCYYPLCHAFDKLSILFFRFSNEIHRKTITLKIKLLKAFYTSSLDLMPFGFHHLRTTKR